RIVAVCECLVGVLIDAGIIKTVSVGCVGIQRKTLVCADAIRGEARVVIGESETRPKEQTTADLRGCGGSRSQPECRLDALKDVARSVPDVADFNAALSRQLALNREVPLVV